MVRFFFDLRQDGVLSPDDTGLECAGNDAATREGATALVEMAKALVRPDRGSIAMMVRDEFGTRVCTMTLALSVTF